MSALQLETDAGNEALMRGERAVLFLYIISALAVFILMMLLGLGMRLAQGTGSPSRRSLLSDHDAHGAGMVGVRPRIGCGDVVLPAQVRARCSLPMFVANYVLFMLGAVAILGAIFIGSYAGAWTFLYPLPVHSMGVWSAMRRRCSCSAAC